MEHRFFAPGPCVPRTRPELFGFYPNSSLGLAAGFDKTGELVNVIEDYGFGWVEVGSITRRGGPGNPKPRLFRYGQGLLNRMGLNGPPVEEVVPRLLKARCQHSFAVNIAKTHDPEIMGDDAIRDIIATYVRVSGLGIYTALNISCPNTREGRTFEDPHALSELLSAIRIQRSRWSRPLVVKLSPVLGVQSRDFLDELIGVCEDLGVQGYIAGNTDPLCDPHPKYGVGGVSGPRIFNHNTWLVTKIRWRTNKLIIGCGGITDGCMMDAYRRCGANFFQAYTGFVRGPNAGTMFAHKVNEQCEDIVEEAGDGRSG